MTTGDDNENLSDDFLDDGDDDHHREPDYYECYACNITRGKKQPGNMCPNCGCYMEEGYY